MSTSLFSNIRSSLGHLRGVLLLTALLGGAVGTVEAAAPAAGTMIQNTASATYQTSDATPGSVTSNTVSALVDAVESITLVPDRQLEAAAGDTVSLLHTLSNTGNVDTKVRLTFSQLNNDNFDLSGLKLVQDSNNNGVADPGEPELSLTDELSLPFGQSISLILTGVVPATVNIGDLSKLQMFGTATGGALSQTVNDTVTIKNYVAPTLTKSASVSSTDAGKPINYTLNLTTGTALDTRTVTVDGSDVQMIVVRDTIPANTTFVAVQQDGGSKVLYQLFGANANTYQTVAPSDLSTVAAIAFGFATLEENKTVSIRFQVKVSDYPSGNVTNTGVIDATINGKPATVPSNPVVVTIPPKNGVLQYRDPTFSTVVPIARAEADSSKSDKFNLYAAAGVCNADSTKIESYFAKLTAKLSTDVEDGVQTQNSGLLMTETGPNTGIFKLAGIPTQLTKTLGSNNNGIVEVQFNDTVNASLVCGTSTLNASILMNPAAVVFNSKTNLPVAGAQVVLIKNPGSTPELFTTVTDANGQFQFPRANAGSYAFKVNQLVKLVFPSTESKRWPDRNYDELASFGKTFQGDGSLTAFVKDIPVDPVQNGFILKKEVSQSRAEIGETVTYTLTLTNSTGKALTNATIEDLLPLGFTLVSGTVRKDGVKVANPDGAPGRKLTFKIGDLSAAANPVVFTYAVLLGTGAGAGNGINTAQGHAIDPDPALPADQKREVDSNIEHVKVIVDKGVFSDQAVIFGKIFVDCNRNDLQNQEELGIPGVRLYLEDGTYVISDEEGKYSLYGISPRTHVLKIDRTTLPAGAEMATLSNRNAGDPQSLFVDAKNGEMHRADFAEGSCTPEILSLVKARRKAGQVLAAKVDESVDLQSDPLLQPLRTDAAVSFDPRSRPTSGVIGADGKIVAETTPLAGITVDRSNSGSPMGVAPLATVPSVNLETLLPQMKSNKFGFVDLVDEDTLPSTDLSIRIAGREGSNFRLFVYDKEIPLSRVGQRARMSSRDLQVWEYVGVKLMPGLNRLRAENYDDFGTLREKVSIMVTAPGTPGKLMMVLPPDGAVADGQTPAHIVVRLLDADNVPVTARTLVTLETTAGRWNVEDLDAKEPGVQTFIQGGEALFDLIPPSNPGTANLRVSSGVLEDAQRLPLDAHLRPLIASGIIEGAIGLNKLSSKSIQPATPADGFEEDIRNLADEGSNTQAGIRGAMFLKGKIKGNMLLTLSYDSDKDTQQRLFRDIDPENYYPVYGDSSIKGFDAQSTSALYVRIDKGRSFLMYGDFNTNDPSATSSTQARQLSNYSRSLTGLNGRYENDKVTINLFASHQSNQQQTTEFRAQGISGPYKLPGNGYLVNSEKIDIVTRDKDQPGVVISTVPQNRYVDYTVDALTGNIIFTSPVAGSDLPGNPVYIRVTWEVENGGDEYWVYGADGTYRINKFIEVGASAVRDNTPAATTTIYGSSATVTLSKDNKITLEAARSVDDATDAAGNAFRAEWSRSGQGVEGRVYASRSDSNFANANGALSAGTTQAGVKGSWQLNESLRLAADGLYTESETTGTGTRQGVLTSLEYALTQNLKTTFGVRFTRQEAADAVPADPSASAPTPQSGINAIPAGNTTSVSGKVSWIPEFLPKSSFFTQYEQSVSDAARALTVGGTYQIADRSRFYARHELISSQTGPFGLSELNESQNSTAIGVDYDYMKSGNVFSEYRVRDTLDGASGVAALAAGLRNSWNWGVIRLSTQFEREQPLDNGASSQENTAVSVGMQYTGSPLFKAGTRLEWRQSETETNVLNTIALARKLSLDWSVLGKNTLSWTDRGASTIVETTGLSIGGATIRDRFRVGAAWRQTDSNKWAWLGLFETRYDQDPTIDQTRLANIVSSNINYQPNRQWVFSGRYAMKLVNESNSGIKSHFIGNLVSGRAMFDITEKWDAGVVTSVVLDRHSVQYGVGAEVGYVITSNLWLSGGYNFAGYTDKDFDDSNYTRQGPYVRLRFKFDEEMFRWLE